MRLTTAENHVDRIEGRLNSVYRGAIYSRPNCIQLMQQFNEILSNDSAWIRLPEWAKERLRAYKWNLRNIIMREHLIQLYTCLDGRKIASRYAWEAMDEETRELCRKGGRIPLKTYWLRSEESCANDGTITIIKRPTDNVYWEDGMRNN